MSEVVNPIAGAEAQQQASATNGTNQPSGSAANASTIFVSNMDELKDKAPEVYKAMVEGIMTHIIGSENRHNEEMKKIIREGQEDNRKR